MFTEVVSSFQTKSLQDAPESFSRRHHCASIHRSEAQKKPWPRRGFRVVVREWDDLDARCQRLVSQSPIVFVIDKVRRSLHTGNRWLNADMFSNALAAC